MAFCSLRCFSPPKRFFDVIIPRDKFSATKKVLITDWKYDRIELEGNVLDIYAEKSR